MSTKNKIDCEYRLKHSAFFMKCNTAETVKIIGLQLKARTRCFLSDKFSLMIRQPESLNKM